MANPFLLDREEAVLCVVDIQEKLAARMEEKERVIANAVMLAKSALRLDVPVIVTEQYPKGVGATVIELITALDKQYVPIEKLCFGCADEPVFMEQLKTVRRRQVLLCGMESHVCVLQTCLQLLDRGYRVHVAADTICSRQREHKELALDQMRQAGAVVTCAEAAVFQLLRRAGTPEFKDFLSIIK